MADFQLVHKLREQSVRKLDEADTLSRETHDLIVKIRTMESEIKIMKLDIDRLTHEEHKLRLEGDRLKNQAFVMSLGSNK